MNVCEMWLFEFDVFRGYFWFIFILLVCLMFIHCSKERSFI